MNPYLLIDIRQIYWPAAAPTNLNSTKALINRLPYRLQVICALEAAKMSIHIWEKKYTSKRLTTSQKEAPKKAIELIETIEKWLDGKATVDEVKKAADYSNNAAAKANAVYADDAARVTYAANAAANAVDDVTNAAAYTVHVNVIAATYVTTGSDVVVADRIQFYKDWWARCYPLLQAWYDIFTNNINGDI